MTVSSQPRAPRPLIGLKKILEKAILKAMDYRVVAGRERYPAVLLQEFCRCGMTKAANRPAIHCRNADAAGGRPRCFLFAVNEDMPHIVGTITAVLSRQKEQAALLIHPLLSVVRDARGRLREISDAGQRESWVAVELSRALPLAAQEKLCQELAHALEELRYLVADQARIKAHFLALGKGLQKGPDASAVGAFLQYLATDRIELLGWRSIRLKKTPEGTQKPLVQDRLGIVRRRGFRLFMEPGKRSDGSRLASIYGGFFNEAKLLHIIKANLRSQVIDYRYLDVITIKRLDAAGKVVALEQFIGLIAGHAKAMPLAMVPYFRDKIERLLGSIDTEGSSHERRRLRELVDSLPRDEIYQASDSDLEQMLHRASLVLQRPALRLVLRRDLLGRYWSALLFVPRRQFSDNACHKGVQEVASALHSICRIEYTFRPEREYWIHQIILLPDATLPLVESPDIDALEHRVARCFRNWPDQLRDLLYADDNGLTEELVEGYVAATDAHYRLQNSPEQAATDMIRLQAMAQLGLQQQLRLQYRQQALQARLYLRDQDAMLSSILPLLENLGLQVISEEPYFLRDLPSAKIASVHLLRLRFGDPRASADAATLARLEAAFEAIIAAATEQDSFNRLVATALNWVEVRVLRALAAALQQLYDTLSSARLAAVLAAHPQIAAALLRLLLCRLSRRPQGKAAEEAALTQVVTALEEVESRHDDLLLNHFMQLILAIMRSNVDLEQPPTLLIFKIASRQLPNLVQPVPWCEIFVFSRDFEGTHLRFGRIARGGIRWSERREDFRTEILGLVKAQQLKNALIVPVGAKGGFVLKGARSGLACYQDFIDSLLAMTDNLLGDRVRPPARIRRRDGDDPYLVVAADKGTARFSDHANQISQRRKFWLDDAFASGGSQGYDHKQMGITARGAWVAVQRHFHELEWDMEQRPFRVVGVGDMSGDVFGNGMLLSSNILLLAAFDHRHIFLDPNPDAALALAERQRLFALPSSSWADYKKALISAGGGVYRRSAKRVAISAEVAAMCGIKAKILSPDKLIRELLCSEVELLWFGGIGTYIKASQESDADCDDRANDALRINGKALRARLVGEGANLGMTQRARIEYSQHGGRCNSDAIDNAAGVTCSDMEVNIKILLGQALQQGALQATARNALLRRMTDAVADKVLEQNRQQTGALSLIASQAAMLLPLHQRCLRDMEHRGLLDRRVDALPSDEEIERRSQGGQGLQRPELAVLLGHVKNAASQALIDSTLPADSYLLGVLREYFPSLLGRRFGAQIEGHPLRREIIATAVVNQLFNRQGIAFLYRLREATGQSDAVIARAWLAARDIFSMTSCWQQIDQLHRRIPATLEAAMQMQGRYMLERVSEWLLTHDRSDDIASCVARYQPVAGYLATRLASFLPPETATERDQRLARYRCDEQVPEPLVKTIGDFKYMACAMDLQRLQQQHPRQALSKVARQYFRIGESYGLNWLRHRANHSAGHDHWSEEMRNNLIHALWQYQYELSDWLLSGGREDAVTNAHYLRQLRELRTGRQASLVTIQVLTDALGKLLREVRHHDS